MTVWGDESGITWENATPEVRESFALTRLYWFYRMVACGGPDGTDLDAEVAEQARVAAEWFGPILEARAADAGFVHAPAGDVADAASYRPAGDAQGRCRLESCTLPPHPPGTPHAPWRPTGETSA